MKLEGMSLERGETVGRDSGKVGRSAADRGAAKAVERVRAYKAEGSSGGDAPREKLDVEKARELVEKAELNLKEKGVELKFKLLEDSGDIQVEVLDAASEKVVRKIPPDELVKLSETLQEQAGGFLDRLF